jgi:hypothetical protein
MPSRPENIAKRGKTMVKTDHAGKKGADRKHQIADAFYNLDHQDFTSADVILDL